MRGAVCAGLTLVALLGMPGPASAQAPAVSDEAIAAIADPERHLRIMIANVVHTTRTGGAVAYALGIDPLCRALDGAMDSVVSKHAPEWRRNLIASWREAVPADALAKAAALPAPQAAQALAPFAPKIGERMQAKSADTLRAAATEVLASLQERAAGVDRSTIDRAARERELKAAMEDGRFGCGYLPRRPQGQEAKGEPAQ